MFSEYLNNKRKMKFYPILSLTKSKNKNEKIKSKINKSVNSMSSSDNNSLSISSKKKYSHKFSFNNSEKSVKPYESYNINSKKINITQESSEAKLKKSFLMNISNIEKKKNDFSKKEKFLNLFDNKNNMLILNKKKQGYQKIYGNKINLFKTPLNKELKLNRYFYNKKKIIPIKKNNYTILKKFEGDFHNFYLNSLKKTKDEFLNKIEKINKTFYQNQNSFSKRDNLKNIINLKNSGMRVAQKSADKNILKNNNDKYNIEKSLNSNNDEDSYISKSSSKSKNKLEIKLIKTKYSSQFLKVNENYKRKRDFKQYMNEKNILEKKWKKKLDVIETSTYYNPVLVKDIKFQSGIIKDELCILLDDLQHFRFTFFEDQNLLSAFKNKDTKYQIKLNKFIEETCALLHLIPKLILKDYYYYTDKFISITDPSRELFSKKIVYNEGECFQDNLKYLYKILNFVNCCNEVYSQLIEQVGEEMVIDFHNFQFVRKIFDKIRHYIINLTNICKNILKDYIFDKQIIAKFKEAIKTSKNKKKDKKIEKNNNKKNKTNETYDYSENDEKNKIYIFGDSETKNIEDEIGKEEGEAKDNINMKIAYGGNYLSEKLSRISKALEGNNNTPSKKQIKKGIDTFKEKMAQMTAGASGPMALINSPLMSKMLKYIKKDYKQQIISLRTSERILGNNK